MLRRGRALSGLEFAFGCTGDSVNARDRLLLDDDDGGGVRSCTSTRGAGGAIGRARPPPAPASSDSSPLSIARASALCVVGVYGLAPPTWERHCVIRSDLRTWNVGESVDGWPSSPAHDDRLVAKPRERRRGLPFAAPFVSAYGLGGAEDSACWREERGGVAVPDMVCVMDAEGGWMQVDGWKRRERKVKAKEGAVERDGAGGLKPIFTLALMTLTRPASSACAQRRGGFLAGDSLSLPPSLSPKLAHWLALAGWLAEWRIHSNVRAPCTFEPCDPLCVVPSPCACTPGRLHCFTAFVAIHPKGPPLQRRVKQADAPSHRLCFRSPIKSSP